MPISKAKSHVPNSIQLRWYEKKQKTGVICNEFGTCEV